MLDKFKLFSVVPDSTKEEAFNPTSNLIGQAFRGIAHLVLDPLVKLNIVRDHEIESYAAKIKRNSDKIPEENRDASMIGLTYKSVADSVYQLNSEKLQELFANLIAATVDDRKNQDIRPSFSSILKDLSPIDAQLFEFIFKEAPVIIGSIRVENKNTLEGVTLLDNVIISEDDVINQQASLDTLQRFGLIKINPEGNLVAPKYVELYNQFEQSEIYTKYAKDLPYEADNLTIDNIRLLKGNIRLTELGRIFGSVVISD